MNKSAVLGTVIISLFSLNALASGIGGKTYLFGKHERRQREKKDQERKAIFLANLNESFSLVRCGLPKGSPCRGDFNEANAMDTLSHAGVNLIHLPQEYFLGLKAHEDLNLNLQYVVDNFVYLKRILGITDEDVDASPLFTALAEAASAPRGPALHEATDMMVRLYLKTERPGELLRHFKVIMEAYGHAMGQETHSKLHGLIRQLAVDNFVTQLEAAGGNPEKAVKRYKNQYGI